MSNRGQITIEVAIIFPLICLILLSSLEIGIYLHDKLLCTALLNQYAQTYPKTNETSLKSTASKIVKGNKDPTIYVMREIDFHIYQDVEIVLEYPYKLMGMEKNLSMKVKKTNIEPRKLITMSDVVDDLSENISMMKTYKDTLRDHLDKLAVYLNP